MLLSPLIDFMPERRRVGHTGVEHRRETMVWDAGVEHKIAGVEHRDTTSQESIRHQINPAACLGQLQDRW